MSIYSQLKADFNIDSFNYNIAEQYRSYKTDINFPANFTF
jgi:hypothetical protein